MASPWLLATRPKTLTAAFVPVLVGTALAFSERGSVSWGISVIALLSAVFIQIGTNLANDAIDFRKGADTEKRVGPVRVTQSGLLSYRQVMGGAIACLAVALLLGIPLVFQGGWPLVVVGLVSLFFAYGYTGGPFPLAYLGLGDLFVLLFFGLVAVGGVYFLQTGTLTVSAGVAGAQVGLLATVLIAINNLRDRDGDAEAGKRTLAVRLGVDGCRFEIALLLMLPFVLNLFWGAERKPLVAALCLPALIPAFSLLREVNRTEPGPAYNAFLARAAKVHLIFGVLFSAALIFSR